MKNERPTLSAALLIVAVVLLICIFGFFASWLDWRLQVDEENPIYRFQTLIAGVLALVAAGGTIYMMQHQIRQGRIDSDRRAALDHARIIREDLEALRVCTTYFATSTKHLLEHYNKCFGWKPGEPKPDIWGATYRDPDLSEKKREQLDGALKRYVHFFPAKVVPPHVPTVRVGCMPRRVRMQVTNAAAILRSMLEMYQNAERMSNVLGNQFHVFVSSEMIAEVDATFSLVEMERFAREIESGEEIPRELKVPSPDEISQIAKDEDFRLMTEVLIERFELEHTWDENRDKIQKSIPRYQVV